MQLLLYSFLIFKRDLQPPGIIYLFQNFPNGIGYKHVLGGIGDQHVRLRPMLLIPCHYIYIYISLKPTYEFLYLRVMHIASMLIFVLLKALLLRLVSFSTSCWVHDWWSHLVRFSFFRLCLCCCWCAFHGFHTWGKSSWRVTKMKIIM